MSRSEAIPCPHCGGTDSRVMETRNGSFYLRRQRTCINCARRFPTVEISVSENMRGPSLMIDIIKRMALRLGA